MLAAGMQACSMPLLTTGHYAGGFDRVLGGARAPAQARVPVPQTFRAQAGVPAVHEIAQPRAAVPHE